MNRIQKKCGGIGGMRLLESRNNNTWNSEKEGGNKRRTKQKVEMTWTIAKSDKKASLIGKKTCVGQLWER